MAHANARCCTASVRLITQGIEKLRAEFGRHTGQADSGLLITCQRCDIAARDPTARRENAVRAPDLTDLAHEVYACYERLDSDVAAPGISADDVWQRFEAVFFAWPEPDGRYRLEIDWVNDIAGC